MIPLAYARSQTAAELEDTFRFAGLTSGSFFEKKRSKVEIDGKTFYRIPFDGGEARIYGPKFIIINGVKFKTLSDAKRIVQKEYLK